MDPRLQIFRTTTRMKSRSKERGYERIEHFRKRWSIIRTKARKTIIDQGNWTKQRTGLTLTYKTFLETKVILHISVMQQSKQWSLISLKRSLQVFTSFNSLSMQGTIISPRQEQGIPMQMYRRLRRKKSRRNIERKRLSIRTQVTVKSPSTMVIDPCKIDQVLKLIRGSIMRNQRK
jgi:hypothetical protein